MSLSLPRIQEDNYFTPHQHWKRYHCHDFDCSAVSSEVVEHKEIYSGLNWIVSIPLCIRKQMY